MVFFVLKKKSFLPPCLTFWSITKKDAKSVSKRNQLVIFFLHLGTTNSGVSTDGLRVGLSGVLALVADRLSS